MSIQNFYSPTSQFHGKLKAQAPVDNDDVARKQDIANLSFIKSIATDGSQNLLQVNSGALSVKQLLISSVTVDGSSADLAAFVGSSYSSGDEFQQGDTIVLTAPAEDLSYIHNGGTAGNANDFTLLGSASLYTAGAGLTKIGASFSIGNDQIKDTMIDFGTGANQVSSDDLPEGSTNLFYTNARARAAFGAGSGLTYSAGQYSIGNDQIKDSMIDFGTGANQVSSDDVPEGSTNKYFSDARARAAMSAGSGLSYNAGSGQYALAAIGGDGVAISGATFAVDLATGSGLEIVGGQLAAKLDASVMEISGGAVRTKSSWARGLVSAPGADISYNNANGEISLVARRYETTIGSVAADTLINVTHNLGTQAVHVTCLNSANEKIEMYIKCNSANQVQIRSAAALSNVKVLVSK